MQSEQLRLSKSTRIGVALSGGGNRAAAFGAGVVLGLIDLGVLSQVSRISSTSGGSLVNASVAVGMIRAADPDGPDELTEQRAVAERIRLLINAISHDGFSSYRQGRALASAFGLSALTGVIAAVCLGVETGTFVATTVLVLTGIFFVLLRGRPDEGFMRDQVFEHFLINGLGTRIPHETVEILHQIASRPLDPGGRDRITSHECLLLSSLAYSGIKHNFTISDLRDEDIVHASLDGLNWVRSDLHVNAGSERLAQVVADSMSLPGYARPRFLDNTKLSPIFADGGIFDNFGLSYFLKEECRSSVEVIISVIAENPRQGLKPGSSRLRIFRFALAAMHSRFSSVYSNALAATGWPGQIIEIRIPPELSTKTTLSPLGRRRADALVQAGISGVTARLVCPEPEEISPVDPPSST